MLHNNIRPTASLHGHQPVPRPTSAYDNHTHTRPSSSRQHTFHTIFSHTQHSINHCQPSRLFTTSQQTSLIQLHNYKTHEQAQTITTTQSFTTASIPKLHGSSFKGHAHTTPNKTAITAHNNNQKHTYYTVKPCTCITQSKSVHS
ncbi:hypothetical protein RND81_01G141200 [Saponaria officinalis]|uniref:Uncharacterized protein n=1 Tax=Saponaria officinalis TaxID=3572 RepID=A0AAW1NE24_SAPOF